MKKMVLGCTLFISSIAILLWGANESSALRFGYLFYYWKSYYFAVYNITVLLLCTAIYFIVSGLKDSPQDQHDQATVLSKITTTALTSTAAVAGYIVIIKIAIKISGH